MYVPLSRSPRRNYGDFVREGEHAGAHVPVHGRYAAELLPPRLDCAALCYERPFFVFCPRPPETTRATISSREGVNMEGLRQVFLDFTSFGAGQSGSSEMDSAKFVKLAKVELHHH